MEVYRLRTIAAHGSYLQSNWGPVTSSSSSEHAYLQLGVRPFPAVKCLTFSSDGTGPARESEDWDKDTLSDNQQMRQSHWQWAMTVSYDGTRYSGWQLQPKGITVQQTIETVLSQITSCTRDELLVTAASRTDAGVHAWGQVVSFATPFAFGQLDSLHQSLNAMLPPDVRIRDIRAVKRSFHPRYGPKCKTYQYKAYVAPVMDPSQRLYALHLPYEINVDDIQSAASLFIGTHDFSAFANSSPNKIRSPIREILKFGVSCSGPHLVMDVEGKSFLYKQVRTMIGLLVEIGKGTLPSSAVSEVLASQSRSLLAKISATAPAHGLYLMSIDYDKEVFLSEPKASYGRHRPLTERQLYPLHNYSCLSKSSWLDAHPF